MSLEIGKGKLVLVTFVDLDGKEFPEWVREQKCQKYNLTIGNTYDCSWIGEHVRVERNDIGRSEVGLYIGSFKHLSEIREEKIDNLLDK